MAAARRELGEDHRVEIGRGERPAAEVDGADLNGAALNGAALIGGGHDDVAG